MSHASICEARDRRRTYLERFWLTQALDTRMLSCLLSGMHRAVPFCSTPGEVLLSQLSSLYRCAHSVSFSTGVQVAPIAPCLEFAYFDYCQSGSWGHHLSLLPTITLVQILLDFSNDCSRSYWLHSSRERAV